MKEQIVFDVIAANDLTPFINGNGQRILNLHFFIKENKTWLFRWIQEDTDVEWLKAKIAEGVVYVFND